MTGRDVRDLRLALSATESQLAELLGLSPATGATHLRDIEAGRRPVGGVLSKIITYLKTGTPDDEGAMEFSLPPFLLCSPMAGRLVDKVEFVLHTRYPRFLAAVLDHQVAGLESYGFGIEFLNIFQWIDEPHEGVDVAALLRHAYAELESFTGEDN